MKPEENRRALLEKANQLPLVPGVYLMKNREGRVIYVGKSRKLKNRVSQYFQNSVKGAKTGRMVASVASFDYFLCDTEMEALTLENTLIKQYNPKYNIRLKDAKSYPYIKVTAGEYPRLQFTRTRVADKGRYFGPYSGASVAGGLLRAINGVFRLPSCNRQFPRDIGRGRPCLYYQLGRCCGVCTGKVSPEEYKELIHSATEVLRGNTAGVARRLRAEMEAAAEAERFEAAALLRDRLRALEHFSGKQHVVGSPEDEEDVFGFYSEDYGTAVSVLMVRGGAVVDKYQSVFGADEILEGETVVSLLFEYYRTRDWVPPRILLSFEVEGEELLPLSALLSEKAGRKVEILLPQRGEKRGLCALAAENAREHLAATRRESEKSDAAMLSLARHLSLETVPSRIESYDISNLGEEHKTCGMVVYEDGKFKKSDYRTFRIRDVEGTDDYASMREALMRRFAHLDDNAEGKGFSALPDLILLDGGATHVGVIRRLLAELGLPIPVFGMVKDGFHKTRALCTEEREISIAHDRTLFTVIYRIQEEVHRFSVKGMSAAKSKTLRTSRLQEIPGVGEAKARALLSALGGLSGVRTASKGALCTVPGVGEALAEVIYNHFHREEG